MTKGELVLDGLNQAVSVWRDAVGVPHIEAQNQHDLYLAQGYVVAQDRLFQMDLSRRQASGQLSEVIGDKTIERDEFFRTLGLRRAAEASLAIYSPEAKQVLDWYAQGVNAYIQAAEKGANLPIEFRILGYQPKPWSPIDSLTIGKYMAYDLGGHWEGQAFRYYLVQNFDQEKALDLFPSYPENAPTIVQTLKANKIDVATSFSSVVIPNEANGSNNWVVSGAKSASGKPMLANDPHLGLATPSIWYEVHLKSPDTDVSGVIFAGIPGIIVGHNRDIAWGVTNVGPDVQDLYIEKRNPQNENEFEYMGKWEPVKVVKEEIQVKNSQPIPYEVKITRHGPLISEFAYDNKADTALALRWTALDPSPELEGVLRFDQAKNWEEFKQALTYFHTPAQNFVFASQDGTIAYRANGLIPLRKKGDSIVPVPGWTDDYEWQGFIPWEQLPTVVNPEEGFIATANNKVVDDRYPYHISNVWAQPYREARIRQVLTSKQILSVEDLKNLQFDQKSMQAEEFVPILLKQLEAQKSVLRPVDLEALNLLKQWDFVDRTNLGAPFVFHQWMEQLPDYLFGKVIDPKMYKLFEGKGQVVDQLLRHAAQGNPGPWIKEKGGLAEVTRISFQATIDGIVTLQGNKPSQWNWGGFHKVTFAHPLAAVKPLNLLFNPVTKPMGGSALTVAAAGNKATGEVDHAAPWRTVVDVADMSKSASIVGPGQSGQVLSPWYADQVQAWTTGQYHTTSLEAKDYQRAKTLLHLVPKEK